MGDNGVSTEASGNTVTVLGVNATAGATAGAATIGVASFDSGNFTVTDGFVTLTSSPSSLTFNSDDGSATPTDNAISIDGGANINTSASGSAVLVNLNPAVVGLTDLQVDNLELNGNVLSSRNVNGAITLTPNGSGTVNIAYGTEDAVLVFGASGAISEVGPLTNGQLLIGSTGSAPTAATLTSTGSTVDITDGAGSINLEVGGTFSNSFVTDAGTATPSSGSLTLSGGTNFNTSGAGSTVTFNLDTDLNGLTSIDVDNLTLDGNTLSSSTGDINLSPNASSTVVINTDLDVDDLNLNSTTLSTTATNADLSLTPNGTGAVEICSAFTLPTADGSADQVLTAAGDGTTSWEDAGGSTGFNTINVQTFTANGTYTPTANMDYCIVEIVGGGGAGGGANNPAGTSRGVGGGAGAYVRKMLTSAEIGASKAVGIGAGGTGVSEAAGNGGGNSTFGSILTANGGSGGARLGAAGNESAGTIGGTGTGGDFNAQGGNAPAMPTTTYGGQGGTSFFGAGALAKLTNGNGVDAPSSSYGAGGGGARAQNTTGLAGGAGTSGFCIVTEYITA